MMHERAYSVDLDPQIEAGCLTDLASHCSDKTGKSEASHNLYYCICMYYIKVLLYQRYLRHTLKIKAFVAPLTQPHGGLSGRSYLNFIL